MEHMGELKASIRLLTTDNCLSGELNVSLHCAR